MRYTVLVLGVALLLASSAPAQQRSQQPAAPPATLNPSDPLDSVLMRWEEKMVNVTSLKAEIRREREDKTFKGKDLFVGTATYLKPNLAVMELHRQDNASIFEKYICTGQFFYEFAPVQKQVRVARLPAGQKGQVVDDNFLSFLLGMKAVDAKKRYDLKLLSQDANYYYLEVRPRAPEDQQDFTVAVLALTKNSFLPRGLKFTEPNGNVNTWDIPHIEYNPQVSRTEFATPRVPPGWTMVQVQSPQQRANPDNGQNPQPRVIRPNGSGQP